MPSLGEILIAERRRQGKTLADVVEGTKIRSRLLDSLEQGRYEELPSPAYVKGYIQSYARYLEIPVEPLLEQYKRESAGVHGGTAPADKYLSQIPKDSLVPKSTQAHEIPRNVWIAVAVGVVVIALVSCGIAQLLRNGTGANTTPPPATGGTTTESPGATASETVNTTAGGFKLRVSVRKGLASYVKVTVDGLDGYKGTLQGGESREFLVNDRAEVTVGKPSAVVVTRDGEQVTLPAQKNAHITLSAGE
jgi:cytoskeletal protein RodZ